MSPSVAVRPTEKRTLHFTLPDSAKDSLTFHVALRSYPVRPHDSESRRRARETHRFLRGVPDHSLTHYIEIALPTDAIAMIEVTKPVMVDGMEAEQTVHLSIHIPSAGHKAMVRQLRSGNAEPLWDVHPKIEQLRQLSGYNAADGENDDLEFPEGIIDLQDPTESAIALVNQHPELINLSTDDGGKIPSYIKNACVLKALNRTKALQAAIARAGDDWMKTVPAVGPDGKPLIDPTTGKPVMSRVLHVNVVKALQGPLGEAIQLAKADMVLRNEQWTVQYGKTSDGYNATAQPEGSEAIPGLHVSQKLQLGDNPFRWGVKNRTAGSGLVIDANLKYEAAPAQQTFTVNDMWMSTDKVPLSDDDIAQLLDGKMFVRVSDAAHPDGASRAQLTPEAAPEAGKPVKLKAPFKAAGGSKAAVTGTFQLNDLRTALTFQISATGLGGGPGGTFGIGEEGQPARLRRSFTIDDNSRNGTLTLRCTNEWLRHLSACVQFRDDKGNAIAPKNWSHKMPSGLRPIFEPDEKTKFVSLVPPVRTVFGIPVPADPTAIEIPVPPEASKIIVYYGGLGRGGSYDVSVCPIGVAITVVAEMAVPLILLFAGTAVTNSKAVVALLEDTQVLFAICTVAGFLVAGGTSTYILTSQDSTAAIKDVAIALGPMLLSPATALGKWILQKVAEGTAQRATPFLNVFTTVVSGAVTAANLSQTIIEVLSSPWKYEVEVTRAIDIDITLKADSRSNVFPDLAVRFVVSVIYDGATTLPVQEFPIGESRRSKAIRVVFHDAPAGGRLKIFAAFYAENGWQAGQAESQWFDAKGTTDSTLVIAGLEVTTNDVPLTKDSVYTHKAKLAYDRTHNVHYWDKTKKSPDATATTPSPYPGHIVERHLSITTAQQPGMVGYAWLASGLNVPANDESGPKTNTPLYTVQNLSAIEPKDAYAVPRVGFTVTPGILYELSSSGDGSGRNYFIDSSRGEYDPAKKGSGLHLRRLELKFGGGAPDFGTKGKKSWGRFPHAVDRYVLHPQGVVLGIRYDHHKIYLLALPDAPSDDDTAPLATMASGKGFRDGLVDGPRAIATGLDGRVLILEGGNSRIQAFDINGNPVPYFGAKGDQTSMKLKAIADSKYLDLAVEAKGYLFALRCSGDRSKPENYAVDLYDPKGEFLVTTPRVTADKIVVDFFRNLFSLNYDIILGKDERTEPSVSHWIPPAPNV